MLKIKDHAFRSDTEDLFKLSGILTQEKLNHTPFIVLDEEQGVHTCNSADKLVAEYPPEMEVIVQWTGKFRSDFFRTTVGEVRDALALIA